MYQNWFKVLSLEGGGARGTLTLGVLTKLKSLLPEFDLLIGTSTGGIIVLALACGIDPESIVEWYYEKLPSIFSNTLISRITRFLGLKSGIYSNENLIKACKEVFGDLKMKDLPRKVSVLAYDTQAPKVARINSWEPEYAEMYVWEAAVATASAPIYFKGYVANGRSLIDGGLFAGSPAKEGYAAAIELSAKPIYVLNIGTGYTTFKVVTGTWGILNWLFYKGTVPIFTVSSQAGKESDHKLLMNLDAMRIDWFKFRSIDSKLNEGIKMDTTDRLLLEGLYELGLNLETDIVFQDLQSMQGNIKVL